MHLYGDDLRAPPRKDLDLRQQPWRDGVAHDVRESLLNIEGLWYASHVARAVFDPDEQGTASRVGERDQGLEDAIRGGQVPLELEGFAFRAGEDLDEVHMLGSMLRSASGGKLPSRWNNRARNAR